jgi:hypothetical protein
MFIIFERLAGSKLLFGCWPGVLREVKRPSDYTEFSALYSLSQSISLYQSIRDEELHLIWSPLQKRLYCKVLPQKVTVLKDDMALRTRSVETCPHSANLCLITQASLW